MAILILFQPKIPSRSWSIISNELKFNNNAGKITHWPCESLVTSSSKSLNRMNWFVRSIGSMVEWSLVWLFGCLVCRLSIFRWLPVHCMRVCLCVMRVYAATFFHTLLSRSICINDSQTIFCLHVVYVIMYTYICIEWEVSI